MTDQPIIVASLPHLSMCMIVARMRVRRHIETPEELHRKQEQLKAGIQAWCEKNHVTFDWSDTPGRRSKGREYRIAYLGDNDDTPNPQALYDALDGEINRLFML